MIAKLLCWWFGHKRHRQMFMNLGGTEAVACLVCPRCQHIKPARKPKADK